MTLSSSLSAGVAGLNVNSSRLGAISDNIANSQTNGYKRAETEFSALVVTESGGGQYTAGGVRSAVFREVDQRGGLITSNNPTDLAIGGRGLLPVTPISAIDNIDGDLPLQFVSTGSFKPDDQGVLRTQAGLVLLGWPANRDGTVPEFPRESAAGLEPVQFATGALSGAPTTQISLGVNLPANLTQAGQLGEAIPLSVEYFDNVSASQDLAFTFTPVIPASGSSNEWAVEISDSQTDPALNPIASFTATFDATSALGGTLASVTNLVGSTFDGTTGILELSTAGGPIELELGIIGESTPFTQLSAEFGPTGITKNGAAVGSLQSIDVDENGLVKGVFEGGVVRTLYQIPVADFANVNGLSALDGLAFAASPDSGSLFFWDAGDGPTGSMINFALESSNADLAEELTSLIETQRAYSSNATVIRTVDEMLQETTNLKR